MAARRTPSCRIESFRLRPGTVVAGKYVVEKRLGGGWEGEVFKVTEPRTGAHRAMKLFFPHRNAGDRAVTFYARKLERLRACPIVIQYHHSETFDYHGQSITALVSEYVEGRLLSLFVRDQRGRRLPTFEALHLLYALANGIEQIHRNQEYHGDLHAGNVLVRRQGVLFDVKVVDFYQWGRCTRAHQRDDVADLVRLLYDATGGRRQYASQPPEIKNIVRGLRRDLIFERFRTVTHLRDYLERFTWD